MSTECALYCIFLNNYSIKSNLSSTNKQVALIVNVFFNAVIVYSIDILICI
jgi:hypothetical protein